MKIKFIRGKFTEEQKSHFNISGSKGPDYSSYFTVDKNYIVLGITHISESNSYNTTLVDLHDDIGNCTSVPICLTEIIDPRPSVFWRAKIINNDLVLWPIEFYQDFFHDDLSEGIPHVKRIFDSVVYRLTHEFKE